MVSNVPHTVASVSSKPAGSHPCVVVPTKSPRQSGYKRVMSHIPAFVIIFSYKDLEQNQGSAVIIVGVYQISGDQRKSPQICRDQFELHHVTVQRIRWFVF